MKEYKKIFFIYLFIILMVSSIPGNSFPKSWFSFGIQDKVYHLIEYSILGFLGNLSYSRSIGYKIIIYCILFGFFDELYQGLIPGRFPNAFDVIADALGVILGYSITYLIVKKYD
tara:strand:- start:515 stop:859 length:345 start_codon:yes stop_codon:yes gene_type:complete